MAGSKIAAYKLAMEIEMVHAKDRTRLLDKGRRMKLRWQDEYDPHTATELGSLIYNRLFPEP